MISDIQMSLLATSFLFIPYSMVNLDESIRNYSLRKQNKNYEFTFNFLNEFGEGQYHLLGYAGLYILSKLRNDESLEKFSINGMKAFIVSGLTVLTIKFIIGRARPYMDEGSLSFKPFNINNNYQAFPSGHTMIAFSTTSFISSNTSNKMLKVVPYLIATGVGIARIYKDQHWFSDVIAGASLGIIIGSSIR